IIGYFMVIEILDHTLRDKIRTERLTSGKVLGAYPRESSLRYRRYGKAIEQMSINHISTQILQHLNGKEKRVVNLFSTEEKDGKTLLAKVLESYWSNLGLDVRRVAHEEDFLSEDSQYLEAVKIEDLCSDFSEDEIGIVEYPTLKNNPILPKLLNDGAINILVVRANRTWKTIDQTKYKQIVETISKDIPFFICLMQSDRSAVEDFVGQLPPYTTIKNLFYKLSQFGLTAKENKK
ncbi:MAG: hypothetical protein ACRC8J_05990, partial [Phocaeicola sp.]